jgi:hypothetical protein
MSGQRTYLELPHTPGPFLCASLSPLRWLGRGHEAARVREQGAVVLREKLKATNFGGLLLSDSGIIRCNSIRDTAQAQHKHIPGQCNGHHPGDSEP